LDPTFGNAGYVLTSVSSGQDKAYGISIQPDGKFVVAGFTTSGITGKDFVCIRYNSDGTIDNSFGTNGIVKTDIQTGSEDEAHSIALQTDGKIVLGGFSDNGFDRDAVLVRYNSDGTLDNAFGNNGIVITDFDSSFQDNISVVKIHGITGNIVVGGSADINTNRSKPVVARYLSNGVLDSTFNSTGIRLLWVHQYDYQYLFNVEDLVVQPNGKITGVGWRDFPTISPSSDMWAFRINSDGSMDITFSSDGVNVFNGPFNGHDKAFSMLLKSNNNITLAGGQYISTMEYYFSIREINANGTATNWGTHADYGSFLNDIAYALKEDSNGKFVMAGSSGSTIAKTFALARVTPSGVLDNTFGTNGMITTTFGSNALNECFDMLLQTDNKIVAAGYSGNDIVIARYLGSSMPQLDVFQLVSPANLAVNQNYASQTLDWTDAFGATSYEVEIDINQNFTSSPQTYTVSASTTTLTNLSPNTQYYWRVRASDGTNWGIHSSVWSFTTNSLENFNLIMPANNSVGQDYNALGFDWSDAVGAVGYEIQIALDANFTNNVQTFPSSLSNIGLGSMLPLTTYYWHVRASNNGTNFGLWSNTWNFTTKPDPLSSSDSDWVHTFKMYPNPACDVISIEHESEFSGQNYMIFDIGGKEVSHGNMSDIQTRIDINTLKPGIYYLQVGDQKQNTLKFIKE